MSSFERTKPPISNGTPKSDYSDMEVFREYKRFWVERLVIGTPSQEGKLARDWVKPKELCCSSISLWQLHYNCSKKLNNARIFPSRKLERNGKVTVKIALINSLQNN